MTIRFARAHPGTNVHGVDGSAAMLAEGERLVAAAGLAHLLAWGRAGYASA